MQMKNIDKKWIKWIALSIILGFVGGELLTYLLKMSFNGPILDLIFGLITPAVIVVALLFTLFSYNKEKENTIG